MVQGTQPRKTIRDDEIVYLYRNGMSQADICRKYNVGPKHTRTVLNRAGFNTSRYRRVPPEHEAVIGKLLLAGITYRDAADATDISFHVIRDIAERLPNKSRRRTYRKPRFKPSKREETFFSRYLAGECFCRICVSMHMTGKEIVRCYAMLDDSALSLHGEALQRRLRSEDMEQNTVTSLARKYGISTSVVKAHLNS